jgi:predicted lipoprotein with Yx(FWY)xxD motif
MSRRNPTLIVLMAIAALIAAACSTTGASASPSAAAPTASPSAASEAPSASASDAPSESAAASPSAAADATVVVGTFTDAEWIVAGSNGMTVYTFTKDTKDSGKSACTGGCLGTWPALTVAAGETPTGGDGVTGKLGTITREDDGTLQVTYNGLPLYFFKNDKAPGDTAGIYENWEAVKP